MRLYQRIKKTVTFRSVQMAQQLLKNLTAVQTDLAEIRIYRTQGGLWLYCGNAGNAIPCVIATPDYKRIEAYAPENTDEVFGGAAANFLIRTAFESRFCYEKIISLHAACVELDDFAVAFTGPSGMGKSTRALAWVNAFGAQLISGDRPAVRIENNGSTACGVPWDGKEQIFRDVEKTLRCILEVRRSPSNYLRKLSREQARKLIVQQSFVPMWDTNTAFMAMANISALIRRTPVYRVFCGPDEDAARVIYDILINHPELIREEANDMKIKEGFVLRDVMDEYIVMPTGDNIAKFDGAVVLNEVSAFVYRLLEEPICRDDLLTAVLNEFEVDETTASADLDVLLRKFSDMGILEE